MSVLKTVGMYREMYNGNHDELPSLFGPVVGRVPEDRDRILDYVRNAPPVFDVMETVQDLTDGNHKIPGGPSLISDGEWIWRLDSVHYLSHYSLDFPDDFLAHVRARNYQPPANVDWTDEFESSMLKYF